MARNFYFAWCDSADTFDEEVHAVVDEQVFSAAITHNEGEFAKLDIEILNPRLGFLGPGRQQWCFLSWERGPADIIPLFKGRLVGYPENLRNNLVRLTFVARPEGYEATKGALAETLRVFPNYDPMFFNEEARTDPDAVLEGYAARYHIDRVTHAVTTSDILTGSSTLVIDSSAFKDSVTSTYGSPPLVQVNVKAQANWQQRATGTVNITPLFPAAITSLTALGLLEDWPDPGDNIGGGWAVGETGWSTGSRDGGKGHIVAYYTFDTGTGTSTTWGVVAITPYMEVDYDAEREYTENLEFTLTAGVQPMFTEPGDEEVMTLAMSANADEAVDPPEESGETELLMPIRDLRSRRYFQSERGQQSVQHLICRARAHLLYRSRAVSTTFSMPFEDGAELSCRHAITLVDARFPGGELYGKVTSYTLSVAGSGELNCSVTIGSAVGTGGSASEVAGTPTYIESDYIVDGHFYMAGATTFVLPDEVTVEDYSAVPINDDGLDFFQLTAADVVDEVVVTYQAAEQLADLNTRLAEINYEFAGVDNLVIEIEQRPTRIKVDMKNITDVGPFETTIPVTVSELAVPKYIDLEAA